MAKTSMNLRKRVKDTRGKFKTINDLAGTGKLAEHLIDAQGQLQPSCKKVKETLEAWDTLLVIEKEVGITKTDAGEIKKERKAIIRSELKKYKQQLDKEPPQPKSGHALTNLNKALDKFSNKVRGYTEKSWAQYSEVHVQPAEERLRVASVGQEELTDELRDAVDSLIESLRVPPSDEATLSQVQDNVRKLNELKDKIVQLEVPENVQKFLTVAGRGAKFAMLTPSIYEWIRDNPTVGDSLKVHSDD